MAAFKVLKWSAKIRLFFEKNYYSLFFLKNLAIWSIGALRFWGVPAPILGCWANTSWAVALNFSTSKVRRTSDSTNERSE